MCTSFSTAWRAASAGVANSGPMSTSKPRSAKAEAITFWPRSWPSWPILATRMRGRRPSSASKSARRALQHALDGVGHADLPLVDAGDGLDLGPVAAEDLFQRRRDLADRGLGARGVDGERQQIAVAAGGAARQRASASATRCGSRSRLSRASLSICNCRTAALSTLRTSIGGFVGRAVAVDADHRLARRHRCAPASSRRLPRCAASAGRPRSPWPCRRAPRLPAIWPRPASARSWVSRST